MNRNQIEIRGIVSFFYGIYFNPRKNKKEKNLALIELCSCIYKEEANNKTNEHIKNCLNLGISQKDIEYLLESLLQFVDIKLSSTILQNLKRDL